MTSKLQQAPVQATAESFKAFSWQHGKYSHHHSLQTAALDIGRGVAAILEIIETDLSEQGCSGTPIFNDNYRESLLRMAITSATLLAEKATCKIECENERVRKEAK